jgi:hypothetical protein
MEAGREVQKKLEEMKNDFPNKSIRAKIWTEGC